MCLLTFFPEDVYPDDKAVKGLITGQTYNADGHGYAMIVGDQILTRKGMDPDEILDSFLADREKHPEGPALFHSRIGTDGLNDESNCHPFYIGNDKRTVLAHNGILPSLARPNKKDFRSDTRILAECLLPEKPFGNFHSRLAREAFESWLGTYNKVIILTTNPRYANNVLMFNQDKGHWYHDVWWSNDSYLPFAAYYHAKKKAAEETDRKCAVCDQDDSVDPDYRVCWSCSTCADCLGDWGKGECLCYIKSRGGTTVIGKTNGLVCATCDGDISDCSCK